MIPGMGGMNPKKMQAMMKQLGIKQDGVDASKVVIELSDGGSIVIENPQVQKVEMQGNVTWQVVGDAREESAEVNMNEDDVKLVMEKTGKSEEEVRKVLEETKDIAEAIVKLS